MIKENSNGARDVSKKAYQLCLLFILKNIIGSQYIYMQEYTEFGKAIS